MPRYKITIEYDGTSFSGWQIQPNARTIEEELEKAFQQICREPVDVIGQGRTDAGVHAKGQVAHFDITSLDDPEKLIFGVNGIVGKEINIKSIEKVTDDFHVRFDAKWRSYTYRLLKKPSPLNQRYAWVISPKADTSILPSLSELILGAHDFSGFSKYNEENYTTLCEVFESRFEDSGNQFVYYIRANRFLRNMVRRLIGTMVWVAEGKLTSEEFKLLLDEPESNIKNFTAPAKGLVLESVFYQKK